MRVSCGSGRLDPRDTPRVTIENSRVKTCLDIYLGRFVGPWSFVLFPACRALCFFLPLLFQYFVACVRKTRKSATHIRTSPCPYGARPPGRPDSSNPMASASTPTRELAMQSLARASRLAEPPPAASSQLRPWICQQGLRSARICGLLLLLRRLLLPFYFWSYFVLV